MLLLFRSIFAFSLFKFSLPSRSLLPPLSLSSTLFFVKPPAWSHICKARSIKRWPSRIWKKTKNTIIWSQTFKMPNILKMRFLIYTYILAYRNVWLQKIALQIFVFSEKDREPNETLQTLHKNTQNLMQIDRIARGYCMHNVVGSLNVCLQFAFFRRCECESSNTAWNLRSPLCSLIRGFFPSVPLNGCFYCTRK